MPWKEQKFNLLETALGEKITAPERGRYKK
jgi:hypothetical protein